MKRLWEWDISVDKVCETDEKDIKELIFEVNFNVKKAKYIKSCAEIIKNEYEGKVPNKYLDLLKLPGVGIYNFYFKKIYL
jgi:endonuclease-3